MLQNGLERKRKLILFSPWILDGMCQSYFIHSLSDLTSKRNKRAMMALKSLT